MGPRAADQIRREFIEFFEGKGHIAVPSAPVVPPDDPTLMFTNAGMNQFKDVFLGTGSRPYRRAVDTQKCIRAGGKHNDLEEVGHDTYHHTLFEMLGNWSFGDYFKREAIRWAWELLTEVWGIDKRRLHVTYFEGDQHEGLQPDTEARDLWASVTDIDPSNVHPGNKKDNFWEMGDTGPCGPCSEIHIDLTPDKSGGSLVNVGDARIIEIWNLVFIEYNRASDGKLSPLPARHVDTGMGFERIVAVLQGMGRGRLGQTTNYDTDIFTPIFAGIREITGAPAYTGLLEGPVAGAPGSDSGVQVEQGEGQSPERERGGSTTDVKKDIAYRVIADHIRCLTFAMTDGATPSNEGRGYVLRRILRRAVFHGWQYLAVHGPFLHRLVPLVVDTMGHAFPELNTRPEHVMSTIYEEEESFGSTLERGLAEYRTYEQEILLDPRNVAPRFKHLAGRGRIRRVGSLGSVSLGEEPFVRLSEFTPESKGVIVSFEELRDPTIQRQLYERPPQISGAAAFKLYATHGFPRDLTEVMARELGLTVDTAEYERLMEEARDLARTARTSAKRDVSPAVDQYGPTVFARQEGALSSRIFAIFRGDGTWFGTDAAVLRAGEQAAMVLEQTNFYAESGGQVGDRGVIELHSQLADIADATFDVEDTQKRGNLVIHFGRCRTGTFYSARAWDQDKDEEALVHVKATVDWNRRRPTMQNHTATHILNWALREVLEIGGGGKVEQKGSLVDPDKTRFDFSHNKPLTPEEIERVEALCNEQIQADRPVYTKEVPEAEARKINTLRAVFGEKYPEVVRVVSSGADIDAMLADPQNPEWMKYPVEFCGGTHVKHTSEIGAFVLTTEESVAKGIRRVVGITGEKAQRAIDTGKHLIEQAAKIKSGPADQVASGLAELLKQMADAEIPLRDRFALRQAVADLQKIAKQQSKQQAAESAGLIKSVRQKLLDDAEKAGGSAIIVGQLPDVPVEQVREAADWLRTRAGSAAVCLGVRADDKAMLVAAMTDDLVAKGLKAGDLIKHVAGTIDGRGGGKPNLAQAGGTRPEGIPDALAAAAEWIRQKLA